MKGKGGFTLVELVVVVAIVAILAAVATPAYINYVNRSKQGQAESMLFTARLEEEEFLTDNGHYAATMQCLPSFAGTSTCLASCETNANCSNKVLNGYYTFSVSADPVYSANSTTAAYYQVQAARKIYARAATDVLTISSATNTPIVQNTAALSFSVFQWLFNN